MNENFNLEYGTKGMHNAPKDVDNATRRTLNTMYRKVKQAVNNFITTSDNPEDWTYCRAQGLPPFYFAVKSVMPYRPTDKAKPEETFTGIRVRVIRSFIGYGIPDSARVSMNDIIMSATPTGVERYNNFLKAMEEAKVYQASGRVDEMNPALANFVFKLSDAQLSNIAYRERFDEKKLNKLISSILTEEIKKLL